MAQNAYYEIYLHIVWHTKGGAALLRGPVEACAYRMITERIRNTRGVYLDGLGGTDDRVHLAVHIAPTVLISDMIGELKGGSSHDVNETLKRKVLYCRRGMAWCPLANAIFLMCWITFAGRGSTIRRERSSADWSSSKGMLKRSEKPGEPGSEDDDARVTRHECRV